MTPKTGIGTVLHVAYAGGFLLLLVSSCARAKPDTVPPQPQAAAPQPAPAPRAATPAAPPARPPVQSPAKPAPGASAAPSAPRPATAASPATAPPAVRTPAPVPTLDLTTLEARLRETKAIGFFTKVTLKNQVNDLLDKFQDYHQRKATLAVADLRRSYDLLIMKVLSLLQDDDPRLAMAIVSSRVAIWDLLVDPVKFATLKV